MATSLGHDLTRNDPADLPRCPMERLADRFMDAPLPKQVKRHASREPDGSVYFTLEGWLTTPEQIDDLINYLARVKP